MLLRGARKMPPKAILFDLDETLTDRSKSLMRYSNEFLQFFKSYFTDVSSDDLYQLLKIADGNGYRLRDDVFANSLRSFLGHKSLLKRFKLVSIGHQDFPFVVSQQQGCMKF
jgi:FMN phosphatase YigB (HAD superfamily)